MLLRWLVGNVIRQQVAGIYQEALTQAARLVNRTPALAGAVQVPDGARVAVVFAMGIESAGLVAKLHDPAAGKFEHSTERFGPLGQQLVRVADVGVGARRAALGTEELLARGPVGWIVSAGFAGALAPNLRRGDILMADTIVHPDGEQLGVGFRIDPKVVRATPHLHVGRLLTVDRVISTPEQRRQLAERYAADACDMESFAVARVCQQHRIRFLSVRVITDAADDRLPPELQQLVDQPSLAGKLGAAAGAIWQRPGSVKDMWNLREQAQRASARLADFLSGVLPQLPE